MLGGDCGVRRDWYAASAANPAKRAAAIVAMCTTLYDQGSGPWKPRRLPVKVRAKMPRPLTSRNTRPTPRATALAVGVPAKNDPRTTRPTAQWIAFWTGVTLR